MTIIDSLRKAIREKIVCRVTLSGESFSRIVHPHGLAVLTSAKTSIVCWQIQGFSVNGSLPGFRHLSFDRCAEVVLLEEKFEPQLDFDPAQKMVRRWLLKTERGII